MIPKPLRRWPGPLWWKSTTRQLYRQCHSYWRWQPIRNPIGQNYGGCTERRITYSQQTSESSKKQWQWRKTPLLGGQTRNDCTNYQFVGVGVTGEFLCDDCWRHTMREGSQHLVKKNKFIDTQITDVEAVSHMAVGMKSDGRDDGIHMWRWNRMEHTWEKTGEHFALVCSVLWPEVTWLKRYISRADLELHGDAAVDAWLLSRSLAYHTLHMFNGHSWTWRFLRCLYQCMCGHYMQREFSRNIVLSLVSSDYVLVQYIIFFYIFTFDNLIRSRSFQFSLFNVGRIR